MLTEVVLGGPGAPHHANITAEWRQHMLITLRTSILADSSSLAIISTQPP